MNQTEFSISNPSEDGAPRQRPRLVQIVTSPVSANCLMRGQLAYMRERGFDVTVISNPGTMLDEVGLREGVRVIGVPMHRAPRPRQDLRALRELTKTIREIAPDVVHYSTPKAGLLGSLAAYHAKIPVRIYTLRGMRSDGLQGAFGIAMRGLEMVPCRLSDTVVCVSQSLRQRALELGIAPAGKLLAFHTQSSNGVDSNHFQRSDESADEAKRLRNQLGIPQDARVVGFVGRMCRDKGAIELVEAFQELLPRHDNVHLLCVGPDEFAGDMPEWIRRYVQQEARIHFTGMVSNTLPVYELIDLLVLPTYREGLPNVALEAASMSLPVVATKVTGCVDAVSDGETGTLIPARDSRAIADAVDRYLRDDELRESHGANGRLRVQLDFQPIDVWRELFDTYIELMRAKHLSLPQRLQSPVAPRAVALV